MHKQSELGRLGHHLAAEAAEGWIESCCARPNPRAHWYDIKQVSRPERADVARSVKYLELRGLLKRHPPTLIWCVAAAAVDRPELYARGPANLSCLFLRDGSLSAWQSLRP